MSLRRHFPLVLTLALAVVLDGQAWGHPIAFFPGQAFCPPRTLIVGTVIIPQQQCVSVFVMRTSQGAFLGFVPAGLFVVPLGQSIGFSTSLGARIRARTLLVLPVALPVFFVPMNVIRLEAFQVEDVGGQLGVRLAGEPHTLVPITLSGPSGSGGASIGSSAMAAPGDLLIEPPGRDIPPDEAAFSGRWSGQWKGESTIEGLPHFLAIEHIVRDDTFLRNERRVAAVFGWGRSSRWDVLPGWLRADGVFQRGVLFLTLSDGAHASYRMSVDGTLDGTYESPDFGVLRAVLSRVR